MAANIGDTVVDYSEKCILCCQTTKESLVVMRRDGISKLLQSCESRGNTELHSYLSTYTGSIQVHHSCRKSFNDMRKLATQKSDPDESGSIMTRCLRSQLSFEWKIKCFFCSGLFDKKHCEYHHVTTLEFIDRLRQVCVERADEWGTEVHGRLESCNDLVAEEAVYHHSCYFKFTQNRNMRSESSVRGRPESAKLSCAFDRLCDWIEEHFDTQVFTLQELFEHMSSEDTEFEMYSTKHLKRKLVERYGDHIVFSEVNGRRDVVCFKNVSAYIISDKWYTDRHRDVLTESQRVVHAAAKLIAASIRDMKFDAKVYPSSSAIQECQEDGKWVPSLLQLFLKTLISSKTKQSAISQCIVQAARPTLTLMPLLLGVTLSIDHLSGSKELVTEVARLGLCLSYDELRRFKQSVVAEEPVEDAVDLEMASGFGDTMTHFVADNVDHNVITLDGRGTFHGMGIIRATSCLSGNMDLSRRNIVRLAQRLTVKEIVKNKGITIHPYHLPLKAGLREHIFRPFNDLRKLTDICPQPHLSLLWDAASLCRDSYCRPSWSGFMQEVTTGSHVSAAVIEMLPLIDLNPGDESCIYSTLLYVCEKARQHCVRTPCITFDQPLWVKAVDIIQSTNMNVVCRLGGFHMLMSFLGSIGTLMNGSGLAEMFELNYGSTSVVHMLSGKAYSKAVRGHFLVEGALVFKLLMQLVHQNVGESDMGSECEDEFSALDVPDVLELVNTAINEKVNCDNERVHDDDDSLQNKCLLKLKKSLDRLMERVSSRSRTAKLWIQYIHYVRILKYFIMAERIGNWKMHLYATSSMLNLLAATGHHNYAKCARLYLQMMLNLQESHPDLYEKFMIQGHSIRRSSRYWAGLSSDLVIEQTMMKAIKGRGGLTHGRGMGEAVRLLWTSSVHECATWHVEMKKLAKMTQSDSHQHPDCSTSRIKRDNDDMHKVVAWLDLHDPFCVADGKLCSLSSGLTASESDCITCDDAESVGAQMHSKVDNTSFAETTFRKCDTVRTFIHIGSSKSGKKKLEVSNCSSLFHRLILLIQRSPNIISYFSYELMSYPPSLFKDGVMRKADKPALAKTVLSGCQLHEVLPQDIVFVIDGCALLHTVCWLKTSVTFADVVDHYVHSIMTRYGRTAVIVFDGYEQGASTKDHEHMRRSGKVTCPVSDVDVALENHRPPDQYSFLRHTNNKCQLIHLLMRALGNQGIRSSQGSGDADTDIVRTALDIASAKQRVAVAADDTDILAMLVHHADSCMADIYLVSQVRNRKSGNLRTILIQSVKKCLGPAACKQILVLHSLGGCDTTSSIYGMGKGTVFRKLSSVSSSDALCAVLQDEKSSVEDVHRAGLVLIRLLYCKTAEESLDKLRYTAYCKIAAESPIMPRPEKLPPTEGAAFKHIERAHLQAVRWKTLKSDAMDACLWGWKKQGDVLMPVMTDMPVAPDDILKVVRCKCKTGCRSTLCSCRKNSLPCVSSCETCRGESCTNVDTTLSTTTVDSDTDTASECSDDSVTSRSRRVYFDVNDWAAEEMVEFSENSACSDADDEDDQY